MEKADIGLIKYRQWLIPAGGKSYQKLVDLGFPITRIHEDSQELLSYALKKKGMTAKVTKFQKVLSKFQDEVCEWWMSRDPERRECRFEKKAWVFKTTKKSASVKGLKDAERLKSKLEDFLRRWGFIATATVSEAHGLVKVQCAIAFSEKPPVITVKDTPNEAPRKILQFGFTRFVSWTIHGKFHWRLETQTGTEWVFLKEGSCLVTEVCDPTEHLKSLMEVFNV
ncbi:hypothetical protein [Achromobacter phage Motura]|uniref:Uncharacterized protein n=1 Tax=Achromobacter phage Motura TaxID=2591403 RepID=A0A514CSM5_9CAUD|nr:hypothetical protein H1O15_gp333 [Achromobacter phage Motura]QDH83473.1 hypothetical protein [Achromobacter phage Motura]